MGSDAKDMNKVVFTNLKLLGFQPQSMENQYRMPFNSEMFMLPNKKGFEVVMHFLFSKLNPVMCREQFRYCWPVGEKKQEQEFRKICNNWLAEISKDDPDAHLPRIVASLFMSPGGPKFYRLLLSFSSYLLLKTITNNHGVKPQEMLQYPQIIGVSQSLRQASLLWLEGGTKAACNNFLQQAKETAAVQSCWTEYANDLVREYREFSKSTAEQERNLRRELQTLETSIKLKQTGSLDYDFDTENVRRAQKVRKVRELWKRTEEHIERKQAEKEIVDSILKRTLDKYKINTAEVNLKVPDLLLRECEAELHRRNVENIYDGGKLNLVSLIHLWNLSLHLYVDKLHQVGVPDFINNEADMKTHVHNSAAHKANIKDLRERLGRKVLPELHQSINNLRHQVDAKVPGLQTSTDLHTTPDVKSFVRKVNHKIYKSLGLGLIPATPPASFEPIEDNNTTDQQICKQLACDKKQVSTPEAASELMASIHRKVQHQQALTQGSPIYGLKPNTKHKQRLAVPVATKLAPRDGMKSKQRYHSAPSYKSPMAAPRPAQKSGVHMKHTAAAKSALLSQSTASNRMKNVADFDEVARHVRRNHSVMRQSSANLPSNITPPALTLLADQITDSVMLKGEDRQEPLLDGVTSLGQQAFQTQNKLKHTPEEINDKRKPPTWNDTLQSNIAQDPMSSTRLDESRPSKEIKYIKRKKSDRLETKLFSPEQSEDEERNILTMCDMAGDTRRYHIQDSTSLTSTFSNELTPPQKPRTSSMLGDSSPSGLHTPSVSDINSPRSVHSEYNHQTNCHIVKASPPPVSARKSSHISLRSPSEKRVVPGQEVHKMTPVQRGIMVSPRDKLCDDEIERTAEDLVTDVANHSHLSLEVSPEHMQPPVYKMMSYVNSKADKSYQELFQSQTPVLSKSHSLLSQERRLSDRLGDSNAHVDTLLSRRVSDANDNFTSISKTSHPVSESRLEPSYPGKMFVSLSSNLPQSLDSQKKYSDSSSDLSSVDEGARLIEFQAGSFSETKVKTPSKSKSKESSVSLSHKSPLQQAQALESETDDLISRFNQLKVASALGHESMIQLKEAQTHVPSTPPPSHRRLQDSPPLSPLYLQRTPKKEEKPSCHFQLDFDILDASLGDDGTELANAGYVLPSASPGYNMSTAVNNLPTLHRHSQDVITSQTISSSGSRITENKMSHEIIHNTLSEIFPSSNRTVQQESSVKPTSAIGDILIFDNELGLDDEDFSDIQASLMVSPFSSPAKCKSETNIKNLRSLPMSPMTNAVHSDILGFQEPSTLLMDDIFSQDQSVLLPPSPRGDHLIPQSPLIRF